MARRVMASDAGKVQGMDRYTKSTFGSIIMDT